MKLIVLIIMLFSFGFSAHSQKHEPEAPEKPDMTLLGKESGKKLHLEDTSKDIAKHSSSKNRKKQTDKKKSHSP